MADPVSAMCEQLVKAVNVMMDAESNQRYRLEALKVPESRGELTVLACSPAPLLDKQPEPSRAFGKRF